MKERIAYFDNAKFILIFLVVIGHMIDSINPEGQTFRALYNLIYSFHMPAFIIISGYFAKESCLDIKKYLTYYVVFEILYFPLCYSEGELFLTPYYILWFLLSLISWHLMLLVFKQMRYPFFVSLAIGVLAGYFDSLGWFLSLVAGSCLLPIFLLSGTNSKTKKFDEITIATRIFSATICISVFVIAWYLDFNINWFKGAMSYAGLGHPEWYAGLYRILTYFITSVMCLSFFILVPRRIHFFTAFGKNTISVFVLHGFFMIWVSRTDFFHNLSAPLEFVAIFAVCNYPFSIVILHPCSAVFTKLKYHHRRAYDQIPLTGPICPSKYAALFIPSRSNTIGPLLVLGYNPAVY